MNYLIQNKIELLNLINQDTYFMIDIDGVCIDTEHRIALIAKEIGWREAFRTINWHDHIFSSVQINHSLDILYEVQFDLKRIQLLTHNHSFLEHLEKISFFRQNGIFIPIISVPSNVSKSFVVSPKYYNGNVVLVDDKIDNVLDWNANGGIGVLFSDSDVSEKLIRVRSLDFMKNIK